MKVQITVEVDEGDPSADPEHEMGITEDAHQRLTGYTTEHGAGALQWLGEVEDVKKVA